MPEASHERNDFPYFRSGDVPNVDASPHIVDLAWPQSVDIDPLISMVDEAVRRFRNDPDKSDTWLAPRLHATLRLTRREAADKRMWYWLNVVAKPDCVRWRFGGEDARSRVVALDRFMGEDSKNALGRLWWAAELTRNGKDSATFYLSDDFSDALGSSIILP